MKKRRAWLLADLQGVLGGVGAGAGRGAGAGAEDGCEAAATPLRLTGPAPEDGRRPRGRAQKGHAWVLIGDFHFCSGATVID
jgi:hypothetical protein